MNLHWTVSGRILVNGTLWKETQDGIDSKNEFISVTAESILIYLLTTFIWTDGKLFALLCLVLLFNYQKFYFGFGEFKPALGIRHPAFNSVGQKRKCRLFIYFGRLGLFAFTRLFTVCRNEKPQTQLSPAVDTKLRTHWKPTKQAQLENGKLLACGKVKPEILYPT